MREHRRPAGVDPTVLEASGLDPEARAIGRRVAAKMLALAIGHDGEPQEFSLEGADIATIVEAEIRSTRGTPPIGSVDVRLSYDQALALLLAIVDAQRGDLPARDQATLADLRAKFFDALGLAFSC